MNAATSTTRIGESGILHILHEIPVSRRSVWKREKEQMNFAILNILFDFKRKHNIMHTIIFNSLVSVYNIAE